VSPDSVRELRIKHALENCLHHFVFALHVPVGAVCVKVHWIASDHGGSPLDGRGLSQLEQPATRDPVEEVTLEGGLELRTVEESLRRFCEDLSQPRDRDVEDRIARLLRRFRVVEVLAHQGRDDTNGRVRLTAAILLRRIINNAARERSEPAASVMRRQQELLVMPQRVCQWPAPTGEIA
jgi:hypothetical protein